MNKRTIVLAAVAGMSLMVGPAGATSLSIVPLPISGTTCIAQVVDKRDSAIMKAFNDFVGQQTNALVTRQSALKTAWQLTDTDAIKKSVRSAWDNYHKTHQSALHTYKEVIKSDWQQYKKDLDTCHASDTYLDIENAGHKEDELEF